MSNSKQIHGSVYAGKSVMSGAIALTLAVLPLTPSAAQNRDFGGDPAEAGYLAEPNAALTSGPAYAELVDLADAAPMVLRATVRKQATVKPERAPGLAPNYARLYIEARTTALISGSAPIGESVAYVVDVPLESQDGSGGKVPKLKKREVLLFARPVPAQPGAVQLVGPGAQMLWSPELERRLRPILADLVAPDAPPVVTGVREALSVEGNLAGESETQLFLDTRAGDPVSATIVRRPGQTPVWGVSWTEIVDQSARAPQPQTLAWYRLACFLPARLPPAANLSRDASARQRAESDYAFMMSELGPCRRG